MIKIALAQFGATKDTAANLNRIVDFIREAAAKGSQVICLPELSTNIYFCNGVDHAYLDLAEPIPGPSTQRVAEAAKETGMVVVLPMYEKVTEGEFYNTAVIIGPRGEIIGKYRKTHIPYAPRPDSNNIEKFYFRPGNLAYPVIDTPYGVRIGVIICYDRHFPESVRCLALSGAEVVFIPVATTGGGFVQNIWELEMRAHAVFNNIYTAGVNKVAREAGQTKEPFFGTSMLVNPRGEIVAKGGQEEEIVYGDMDAGEVQAARRLWFFFRDRRPELYSILVDTER